MPCCLNKYLYLYWHLDWGASGKPLALSYKHLCVLTTAFYFSPMYVNIHTLCMKNNVTHVLRWKNILSKYKYTKLYKNKIHNLFNLKKTHLVVGRGGGGGSLGSGVGVGRPDNTNSLFKPYNTFYFTDLIILANASIIQAEQEFFCIKKKLYL